VERVQVFVVPVECPEDRFVKLLERLVAAHRNPAPDAPRPFQGDLEDVVIAGARLGSSDCGNKRWQCNEEVGVARRDKMAEGRRRVDSPEDRLST
jgi:hypothetical protein